MHRCEASRISIGLKSCCIGNRGAAGEFVGISQVIFINHPIHHRLTEKIGPPPITGGGVGRREGKGARSPIWRRMWPALARGGGRGPAAKLDARGVGIPAGQPRRGRRWGGAGTGACWCRWGRREDGREREEKEKKKEEEEEREKKEGKGKKKGWWKDPIVKRKKRGGWLQKCRGGKAKLPGDFLSLEVRCSWARFLGYSLVSQFYFLLQIKFDE